MKNIMGKEFVAIIFTRALKAWGIPNHRMRRIFEGLNETGSDDIFDPNVYDKPDIFNLIIVYPDGSYKAVFTREQTISVVDIEWDMCPIIVSMRSIFDEYCRITSIGRGV